MFYLLFFFFGFCFRFYIYLPSVNERDRRCLSTTGFVAERPLTTETEPPNYNRKKKSKIINKTFKNEKNNKNLNKMYRYNERKSVASMHIPTMATQLYHNTCE